MVSPFTTVCVDPVAFAVSGSGVYAGVEGILGTGILSTYDGVGVLVTPGIGWYGTLVPVSPFAPGTAYGFAAVVAAAAGTPYGLVAVVAA